MMWPRTAPRCIAPAALGRALTLGLLLYGCATPVTPPIRVDPKAIDQEVRLERELRFKMAYVQQQRVLGVAFPLLTGAVKFCKDATHYVTGMRCLNRRSFERGSAAISVLGLTDDLKITTVIPGSPVDLAGVQPGDFVLAGDGSVTPRGEGATEALQQKLEESVRDGKSFSMTLGRNEAQRNVVVAPVKACAFSVTVVDGDVVNAFADGTTITVTVGMLRFIQDDTELAFVISHDLGHNLIKHLAAKSGNEVSDLLATIGFTKLPLDPDSPADELEAEADYVGLYLMASAGGQIDRAPQFWRRMGATYPSSNKQAFGASHPSDWYRMIAMQTAVRQITRLIDERRRR